MRIFRLNNLIFHFLFALVTLPFLAIIITEGAKIIGLQTIPVEVAGTGSMYPSLFWSTSEEGPEDPNKELIPEYRTSPHLYSLFLHPELGRGDLVAFKNDNTRKILISEGKNPEVGFIKRIIAVPGDTLQLRDGFVYLNDSLLDEPYLAAPRSTYGDTFLPDCKSITIPPTYYFVMGDNRKVSADSRASLGLVNDSDISYYLPYAKQSLYHSLYRDTSQDATLLGTPTLEATAFLDLVNRARQTKGIAKLRFDPSLNRSATVQGQNILTNNPLPLATVTNNAHYNNIILGEFSTHGRYSATELYTNLMSFPDTAKQILNPEYQDLGIGVVNQEVDGCPQQIIVGHLGGYVPPDYSSEMLQSWSDLASNLHSIIPSWEQAQSYPEINQEELAKLLDILKRRVALADEVVIAIKQKEWFSSSLKTRIESDKTDATNAEQLINRLNQQ